MAYTLDNKYTKKVVNGLF